MIRRIRGTVVAREKDHIVVEIGGANGGFGVKLFVPEPLAAQSALNTIVVLHTYLQVREDALNLFGFESEDELAIFELLLGVNGVGPKVALSALSTLSPDALRAAVAGDEPALIARVPGIGKRTAEKIVLDLRDKIDMISDFRVLVSASDADAEVVDALITLGYSVVEAQRAVQALPKNSTDGVEERLRLALSQFNS